METVTLGKKSVNFFGFNTELYPQVSVTSPHLCSKTKPFINTRMVQWAPRHPSSHGWSHGSLSGTWGLGQKVAREWLFGSSMDLIGGRYLRLVSVFNGQFSYAIARYKGIFSEQKSQLCMYNLEMPPRFLYKREKGRGKLKKIRLSWKQALPFVHKTSLFLFLNPHLKKT